MGCPGSDLQHEDPCHRLGEAHEPGVRAMSPCDVPTLGSPGRCHYCESEGHVAAVQGHPHPLENKPDRSGNSLGVGERDWDGAWGSAELVEGILALVASLKPLDHCCFIVAHLAGDLCGHHLAESGPGSGSGNSLLTAAHGGANAAVSPPVPCPVPGLAGQPGRAGISCPVQLWFPAGLFTFSYSLSLAQAPLLNSGTGARHRYLPRRGRVLRGEWQGPMGSKEWEEEQEEEAPYPSLSP